MMGYHGDIVRDVEHIILNLDDIRWLYMMLYLTHLMTLILMFKTGTVETLVD